MKKILVSIVLVVFLSGCATTNTNSPIIVEQIISTSVEIAFVAALKNNPSYKPTVITGLTTIKSVLNDSVNYDDLIVIISKQFSGDYAIYAVILLDAISVDKPLFKTYIPLTDSYKAMLIKKIDKLILLANI